MNLRSSDTTFKLGFEASSVLSDSMIACVELIGCDVCANVSMQLDGLAVLAATEKLPISKQSKILRCALPSFRPTNRTSTASLKILLKDWKIASIEARLLNTSSLGGKKCKNQVSGCQLIPGLAGQTHSLPLPGKVLSLGNELSTSRRASSRGRSALSWRAAFTGSVSGASRSSTVSCPLASRKWF